MSTKGDIAVTSLWIGGVAIALYVAYKALPGLLGGGSGGSGTNVSGGGGGGGGAFWGGSYGQGGMAQYVNGGYANGLPYRDPVSFGQALQTNGLSPDSAEATAELYNVQAYANPDGTPYSQQQLAGLIPQYDDPTTGLAESLDSYYALPDQDYVTTDAGGDSGGSVLDGGGDDDSGGF
jgi:hypothetical protein